MESKVNSKPIELTLEDFEKMAAASVASFGAPDQLTMGVSSLVDYINSLGGIPHGQRCEYFSRVRTKLHCGLKAGTITWQQNDILEGAAEAFERMGFFKHVPKD